jgi:hypothetical protein
MPAMRRPILSTAVGARGARMSWTGRGKSSGTLHAVVTLGSPSCLIGLVGATSNIGDAARTPIQNPKIELRSSLAAMRRLHRFKV